MASADPNKLDALPTPPRENLNSHFILGEIIDHIDLLQDEFPRVKIPLLKSHLWQIRDHKVDPEQHLRGFLKVFEDTAVFKDAFDKLDPIMQAQMTVFLAGGNEAKVLAASGQVGAAQNPLPPSSTSPPPAKNFFRDLLEKLEGLFRPKKQAPATNGVTPTHKTNGVNGVQEARVANEVNGVNGANGVNGVSGVNGVTAVKTHAEPPTTLQEGYPRVYEDKDETKTMEVHKNQLFQNWGQSVRNTPLWTFVPTTVLGLRNLVKWAKANDLRVRCSGYRHSWSSTFAQDKHILISLLKIEEVTKLPDPMSIRPEYIDPRNELKVIQVVSPVGANKALCRVGVAVTNEQFRRWAVANDAWALPVDVILVEVTIGGVNGPICHGAGRRHKTVNDYVRAVEYVDANGEHRTISDPAHLKAAAGHFGLLGVVTHITFELDKMSYAILEPSKPDIGLAIPPLSRDDIPIALRKTYTDQQYATALKNFESKATNDYYTEWFWFTRAQQAWVNVWNNTDDKTGVVDYPSPFLTWCQWVQGWLGSIVTGNPIFQHMPGRWQAQILATMGMVNLPPFQFTNFKQAKTEVIKTALPNALHFRRGIQNMRVRDMELEIPIPSLAEDPTKPDYTIVRKAWWDLINLCYEDDDCPMRLTLELRIMGDSDLIMAPQFGNKHGTASIEVISIPDAVTDNAWVPFLQKVADLWLSYKDSNGELLNVRPHWAKEWEAINFRGMPAREYLKKVAYKDAIPQFKSVLADIGKTQDWDLQDIQNRFSNEMWDYIIYS